MNAKEVDFCKYLTGHDDRTIIELFIKWENNRDGRSGQVGQRVIPKTKIEEIVNLLYRQNEGKLPFMLFWQSLDGRPQFKEYDNFEEADKHIKHLKGLGRLPVLYCRLAA